MHVMRDDFSLCTKGRAFTGAYNYLFLSLERQKNKGNDKSRCFTANVTEERKKKEA